MDAQNRRTGDSDTDTSHRAAVRKDAITGAVTLADLSRFAATFGDLADQDVMRQGWE